jgi:iron(III) transport system permease protein
VNNVVVGGLASVVTVVIAAIVAWVSTRSRLRWRRLLDILATAPIALPGTVLGLALLWWYLIVPLPIYATRWLVGIAFVTAFLPYAVRAAAALLGQLSPALEEASAMSGAGWSRTFARIVLPLVAPGLIAAWLYVVARTFTSLALPALLAGPGGEMLPSVVYDLYESARYSELNALGVLMIGGMLAIAGLARLSAILADRWSGLVHDPSTSGERGATPTGIARQERTAE